MAGEVLAVDVGGTKLAVGVVDDAGTIRWDARAQTPRSEDPDQIWGALAEMIEAAPLERSDACGVGVGGPMARGGKAVSPLNIPAWRDFPLLDRVQDLSGLPTFVDNDAKALALGEGWLGRASGYSNYLAMVVSTGVGGGIVLDGQLLDGAGSNAGHIGHVIVEPNGRTCPCGARGCLEAEASGSAIAAITGRPAKEASSAVIDRTGRLVGRAVASVFNLLDMALAVVAGSVALGFGEPFFQAAQAEIDASCRLSFSKGGAIHPAGLGSSGPLIGAAALGRSGLGRRSSER